MADTTHLQRILRAGMAAAVLLAAGTSAFADAKHDHTKAAGAPGTKADRTVDIKMGDNFYEPESVQVKKGETIRFRLRNTGTVMHEFNIGTPEMHAVHQKEMAMMVEHGMLTATGVNHEMMKMDHSKMGLPDMKHDDPNTVLVEPGKTAELVWKFTQDTTLEFACNMPGHYESGMAGKIQFRK